MKLLPLTIAAGLALAALPQVRAETGSGKNWMDHYYETPHSADFVPGVVALSREGVFDSDHQKFIAIGFLSKVFEQNPGAVAGWLRAAMPLLPEQGQRVLVAAAWMASNPAADRYLPRFYAQSVGEQRDITGTMIDEKAVTPVVDIPVNTVHAMDLQWGAFLASGDERYVTNVFTAFGSAQPGLATAARYTLVQNAAADPRVMQVCRDVLSRQPDSVRAQFQAALNDTGAPKPSA
jgi:hypothetical protein